MTNAPGADRAPDRDEVSITTGGSVVAVALVVAALFGLIAAAGIIAAVVSLLA